MSDVDSALDGSYPIRWNNKAMINIVITVQPYIHLHSMLNDYQLAAL